MRLRFSILLVGLAVVWAGAVIAAPAQTPSAGISSPNGKSQPGPLVLDGLDLHDYQIREIDLDGLKKLLLRDPKDSRPLLVNFWATWCDGCREEFPDLVKIDNDYRAKGLNFLSVTLDEAADKTRAVDFLKEMKATMPVVLLNVNDPEPAIHAVDEKWDGALPATFLYDREGKLVFKYFGKIKPAELRAAIDKAVGSRQ
ncbi:MAG TPA: TlpA disulfide reductase family protein [Pyrinomonadaceae bacterium]|nr:TlpA disulfide reductase family protein [Pyrinomonadaceae bacterium]